jgi:5-oxoprolinase (ATP-hydrolysing)
LKNNAEVAVREMLKEMGQKALVSTGLSCLSAVDYMDDGSKINLKIQIDVNQGKAGNDSTNF